MVFCVSQVVCLLALSSAEPFEALISGWRTGQRVGGTHLRHQNSSETFATLAFFRLQQSKCIAIRFAGASAATTSLLVVLFRVAKASLAEQDSFSFRRHTLKVHLATHQFMLPKWLSQGRRTQWQSSLMLCGSRPCVHYGQLRGGLSSFTMVEENFSRLHQSWSTWILWTLEL